MSDAVGGDFPPLGQGQASGLDSAAIALSEEIVAGHPDLGYNQVCESQACCCEAKAFNTILEDSRLRTYTLEGDIDALETVTF